MIAEPGDAERDVNVNETFHEKTDDELSERELKQIEADDQAIQTIFSDLHIADYTQLYDFLKYNQKEVDELKAERIAKIQDPLALMANSNNPYASPAPHQDLSPFNQNYMQQPMPNPKDITDPTTAMSADNRPPMLEKDMYDSWKSRMELYMLNRPHGRMILESVEQGPLIWPSVEVEGVTRLKKYSELSAAEAIQNDCDVKATNIILQGLPPEVYALVSTHKVAKELWERIQMLMQGTSLTKQERECKLYDAFDKFAYQKGETLRDFYLRFSLLLNDMNMYNMKLEQFQERVLNELKHDEKASTSYEHSQEIESLKHTLSEYLKEKESFEQNIAILKDDL
nr:hypothetical protein [Tanacetum cinerariifolium]